MVRGRSLIGLIKLMLNLGGRPGKTVAELAARLGCVERTVWRDLQILEAGGVLLTSEPDGRRVRYFMADGHTRSLGIPFTHDELLALHHGRHLLRPLEGTVFDEALRSALDKIQAGVSPAALQLLHQFDQCISARTPGFKDYARSREAIEILREAVQRRRTVEIEYHSYGRDEVTTRRVDPYHLWYQLGGLYLAAFCHTRRGVLTFAVERIGRLAPCPVTFVRPADFDLERYLEGSFGLFRGKPVRVRLRFSRDVARFVTERTWHPSQQSESLLTGEAEVSLRVAPELDLKRWILSWGRNVEVLEPKKLRDEIRAEWLAALRGSGGRQDRLTLVRAAAAKARKPQGRLRAAGRAAPRARRVAEVVARKA